MPFDPNLPAFGAPDSSAQMRDQLNGLKELIDAGIPGPPGPPGEVTTAALDAAINGTGRNPTSVSPLLLTVSDPPTQAEMQAVVDKLNELIAAARREP